VDDDTPFLETPTVLGSRNWIDKSDREWPELGEVRGAERAWVNGAGPSEGRTGIACGPDSFWTEGQLWSERTPFVPLDWGVPPCCRPPAEEDCPTLYDLGNWHAGVQLYAATIANFVYLQNDAILRTLFGQVFQGPHDFARSGFVPANEVPWAAGWDDRQALVVFAGTMTGQQILGQALGSALGPANAGGFGFNGVMGIIAGNSLYRLGLAGFPIDRPTIVAGHSLGGAVANFFLARQLQAEPAARIRTVTFGEPKAGDQAFANLIRGRVFRLQLRGDFVPGLPPSILDVGAGFAGIPGIVLQRWSRFILSSPGWEITSEGEMIHRPANALNYESMLGGIIEWIATGDVTFPLAHGIGSYISAIQARSDLDTPAIPDCSFNVEDIADMNGLLWFPRNYQPRPNTIVVYRAGNAPPSAPDAGPYSVDVWASFAVRAESGEGDTAAGHYTHTLLAPETADIRDDYDQGTPGASTDTVYMPDEDGTPLIVRFVEMVREDDGTLRKRVYLDRKVPVWPTNNL